MSFGLPFLLERCPRPHRRRRRRRSAQLALLAALLLPAAARTAEPDLAAIRRYSQPLPAGVQAAGGPLSADLRPGDWAWQALRDLVERHGCGGGSRFELEAPLSRFEAAALINGCLPRLQERGSAVLRQLEGSLAPEITLLQSRLEGLEARFGRLGALRFSPTTTLSGQAIATVGANRFVGSARAGAAAANAALGALSVNYDLELALNTSWSGKDLLFLNLRSGNFASSPFGGLGDTGTLSTLAVAFQQLCVPGYCADVLAIDRLLYRWPLGAGFQAVLAARAGQEDLLPLWPTLYASSGVLNVLTSNGAPEAWPMSEGAGGALWWQHGGLSLGAAYVAALGDAGAAALGGIGTRGSLATGSVQIGYSDRSLSLAAIWSRLQGGVPSSGGTYFTLAQQLLSTAPTDAYGIAGSWQPLHAGWLPALSLGWGHNVSHNEPSVEPGTLSRSQSWLVGLQWADAFRPGNSLGMAVGQPVFATALSGGQTPDDGGVILEGWYRLQFSDAISVAPALFWLSRPLGMATPAGGSFGQLGALIQATINF